MKIDAKTPIWVVTDPTPHSTLPDVCFQTTLDGLRLQFAGGLTMDEHPTVFTAQEEAHEEAKNRLLVWRVASQIRLQRGAPEGEVVRVTLHDKDGTVLFDGEVGWAILSSTIRAGIEDRDAHRRKHTERSGLLSRA